jgi:galactose mutarotase-like enzyme
MHTLSNNIITIQVALKGAELQSVVNRQTGLEYLWHAGVEWPKKSPVLFPIVGGLKNNRYTYKGVEYRLSRHGFAREMDFDLVGQTENSLTFSLSSNAETLLIYPSTFTFMIRYTLHDNLLEISFIIQNNGDDEMYASVGAHPAFKVPLVEGTSYEDYYLQFDKTEAAQRWPLSPEGLIENDPINFLDGSNILPLKKELFVADAIVFKDLQSTSITLKSDRTKHGLKVRFSGFPYMGVWAAKGANFVCIEPWCGIADSVNASGKLEDKEGINMIGSGEVFERSYSVELY